MYKIHITFTDGTWRIDTHWNAKAFADACVQEAREVALGHTKVFAAWKE